MKKVHSSFYNKNRELSYQVLIRYFERNNLRRASDSSIGKYSLWGENILYSLEGIKTFITKDFYITILKDEKQLTVGRNDQAADPVFIFGKWDSLFSEELMTIRNIKNGSLADSCINFRFTPKSEEIIDSMDIEINTDSWLLSSITFYYSKKFRISDDESYGPVLKFTYMNYKAIPINEEIKNQYSISNFVKIKSQDNVVPGKAYEGYEIVNNLKFK